MAGSYLVVDFANEETIEAVPAFWFIESSSECWFPLGPQASNLISKEAQPDPSKPSVWSKYAATVLKRCATLLKARMYSSKAVQQGLNCLDAESSDLGRGKRKRQKRRSNAGTSKKQKKPSSSSEADSSCDSSEPEETTSVPLKATGQDLASKQEEVINLQVETPGYNDVTESFLLSTLDFNLFKEEFGKFEVQVVHQFTSLNGKLDSLMLSNGSQFNGDYESARAAVLSLNPRPPYSDQRDFKIFLDWLAVEENQKHAVVYYSAVGGNLVKSVVDTILGKILQKPLALQYSFTGKPSRGAPGKLPFRDTALSDVIIRAVKANSKTKDASVVDIEARIKRYLSTAKDKEGGREERRQSTGNRAQGI